MVVYDDRADTYSLSQLVDEEFSKQGLRADYGWYKESQLLDLLNEGIDWYFFHNVFRLGEIICGDQSFVESIRGLLSAFDPQDALRVTVRHLLAEYQVLRAGLLRSLRTLLLTSALGDYHRLEHDIPPFSSLLKALKARDILSTSEAETIRDINRSIHDRQEELMRLSELETYESLTLHRVNRFLQGSQE